MSGTTTQRDVWAWAQEARRRCEDSGVGFVFDPATKVPCTDGRTIRIPPLPLNASADDLSLLRSSVIHECGHHLRPEVFAICKRERLKPGSPLMVLLNIVEDAAQERASAARWRGDRQSLASGHRIICVRQMSEVKTAPPPDGPVPDEAHKYAAAQGAALSAGADWSPDMGTMVAPWISALDARMPGTAKLYAELLAEDWDTKIGDADTVDDAWQVTRDLHARLFPGKSEEESKQPEKKDKKKKKGDKADGDEDGAGGADGEAEEGDASDEKGEPTGGTIPWELIYHSDHSEDDDAASKSVFRIDYSNHSPTESPVWHTRQHTEAPKPTSHSTAAAASHTFPAALVGEVRRLLQAHTRVRWDHERTEGRLDKRNLTRVVMPRVGDGTYNRSVFQKRAESMSLDVCVTVLVDCSGSMSHQGKFESAADAAMCLLDLADTALKVPCEVLGFTTHAHHRREPRHYEFKTYAERRVPRLAVGARILSLRSREECLWGNADGDSLLWAASRMKARREARKILIVLSDGSPTDSAEDGNAYVNLKAAISTLRARGAVEVYGIGIMDDNVREFYSKDAPVVKSVEQVPAALVATLSDVLQRGERHK